MQSHGPARNSPRIQVSSRALREPRFPALRCAGEEPVCSWLAATKSDQNGNPAIFPPSLFTWKPFPMVGIKDRLGHVEMSSGIDLRGEPAQFLIQILGERIYRDPNGKASSHPPIFLPAQSVPLVQAAEKDLDQSN